MNNLLLRIDETTMKNLFKNLFNSNFTQENNPDLDKKE
jgi:hypothetical protein